MGEAKALAKAIADARRIVALTGAGISTSAGIPDFRGPNGIYRTLKVRDPEGIFDIRRFMADPSEFYRFHRGLLEIMEKAEPTKAHRFLAELEKARKDKTVTIITQNVDGLHQRAGSENVIEIHGGIAKNFCTICGRGFSLKELKDLMATQDVPRCGCSGVIKPDIVFFGEAVKDLDVCFEEASRCDLMLVIGSSLNVTPAALIPSYARGTLAVVNLGEINRVYLGRPIDIMAEFPIDQFFSQVEQALADIYVD